MSAAALILAAGASSRMGRPKALLEWEGETFLDRLIARFGAVCAPVVVVLGHEAEEVRAGLRRGGEALLVTNPAPERGQLSSMQCGLAALPPAIAGVLFTLVDHPNVQPETLQALLNCREALIASPVFNGRRGHPVWFRRDLIAEFLALPEAGDARQVLHRHAAVRREVPVDDPGILEDVDDPAAYRRLLTGGRG